MHNEFNPINNLDCKPFCDGEEVLRFYDMGDVDVAADFGVLIGFAVFFQLCFAVVLYKFHTGRRREPEARMMIMTPVYAAYSVAVLGLVGGAPAQGGPGGGGHRASPIHRRRARVPRLS